jgi:hypothetical protein
MQWCIDARTLGLDEAGRKLEERIGVRIEELSDFECDLAGFCRTGEDRSFVTGGLSPSQVCAWSFYAAWRWDLAGDRSLAERWLRSCINTGSFDSKEWKTALLLLRNRHPDGLRPTLGAGIELAADPRESDASCGASRRGARPNARASAWGTSSWTSPGVRSRARTGIRSRAAAGSGSRCA